MGNGQKPVETIRRKALQAAIWRNENENGVYHAVTLERRYSDAKGEWHTTDSFRRDDLLLLAKMVSEAHSAIFRLQESERPTQTTKAKANQAVATNGRRGQGR